MKLIVGLGNPGKVYQRTRHNVGQTLVTTLAQKFNLSFSHKSSLKSHFAQIGQGIQAVILTYPDTFMNLSGLALQKLVSFYKISPQDLYLVHDDLDLGVGEYKLQFNRGPAGHHGVESVIEHLGTQKFWRYRIGIGHSSDNPQTDHVLAAFTPQELKLINPIVDTIQADLVGRLGL